MTILLYLGFLKHEADVFPGAFNDANFIYQAIEDGVSNFYAQNYQIENEN